MFLHSLVPAPAPMAPAVKPAPQDGRLLGNAAFGAGDFDRAIAHYSSALAANPRDARLLSNRSAAYLCKRKTLRVDAPNQRDLAAHAVKDAHAATRALPAWPDAWHRLYAAYADAGAEVAAVTALEDGMRNCPDSDVLRDELEAVKRQSEEFANNGLVGTGREEKEARATARKTREKAREPRERGKNRVRKDADGAAEKKMDFGDYKKAARTSAKEGFEVEPSQRASRKETSSLSDAERLRANDLFAALDWTGAIEGYTRSIKLAEEACVQPDRRAYSNRSAAWLRRAIDGDEREAFEAAVKDAETCIAMDPTWPKAWFRKGCAMLEDGKPAKARAVFLEGLETCPGDAMLLDSLEQADQVIREEGVETDEEENLGLMEVKSRLQSQQKRGFLNSSQSAPSEGRVEELEEPPQTDSSHSQSINSRSSHPPSSHSLSSHSQSSLSPEAQPAMIKQSSGGIRPTSSANCSRAVPTSRKEPGVAAAAAVAAATASTAKASGSRRTSSHASAGPWPGEERQRKSMAGFSTGVDAVTSTLGMGDISRDIRNSARDRSSTRLKKSTSIRVSVDSESSKDALPPKASRSKSSVPAQKSKTEETENSESRAREAKSAEVPDVSKVPDESEVPIGAQEDSLPSHASNAASLEKKQEREQTLYEVLDVASDATDAVIRRKYYLAARELHPDKNLDDPDATDKFQRVSDAYQILSNPESRALYDRNGEDGVQQGASEAVDPQTLFAIVFGSDQFVNFIGELKLASLASNVDEDGKVPDESVLENVQRDRVRKLVDKLISMLRPWVYGDKSGFYKWAEDELTRLADTNFGADLLCTVGNVYVYRVDIMKGKSQGFWLHGLLKDASYRRQKLSAQIKANAATRNVMNRQRRLHDKVLRLNREGEAISEVEAEQVAAEMARNAVDMMWKISVLDIRDVLEAVVDTVLSGRDLSQDEIETWYVSRDSDEGIVKGDGPRRRFTGSSIEGIEEGKTSDGRVRLMTEGRAEIVAARAEGLRSLGKMMITEGRSKTRMTRERESSQ